MKQFSRTLAYGLPLVALSLIAATPAQDDTEFTIERPDEVYVGCDDWSNRPVDDAKQVSFLLDPENLKHMADETYVEVEGWLVYVSHKKRTVTTLKDGDYHFAIADTRELRNGPSPNLLTCEIIPQVRLDNKPWLKDAVVRLFEYDQADEDEQQRLFDTTFQRVRVRGLLRFGSENKSHDAIKDYDFGGSKTISGHWEIHPVESVIDVETGAVLMGTKVTYEWEEITGRFAIDPDEWRVTTNQSNYSQITGKVMSIEHDEVTGDYVLTLDADDDQFGDDDITAIVPDYYVPESTRRRKTAVRFKRGVCKADGAPVEVGDEVTLSGMRTWRFDVEAGTATAILSHVERID